MISEKITQLRHQYSKDSLAPLFRGRGIFHFARSSQLVLTLHDFVKSLRYYLKLAGNFVSEFHVYYGIE